MPATAGSTLRGTPRSTTTSGARPAVGGRAPSAGAEQLGVEHRQRGAGGHEHDVGRGQRVAQAGEPDAVAAHPGGEGRRPPHGAVGHHHLGQVAVSAEGVHHALSHLAGTDHHHVSPGQRAPEPRGGQLDGHVGQRRRRPGRWRWWTGHDGRPARRGGTEPDSTGPLACSAWARSRARRTWPEDLGLPEDARAQTRRHLEEVPGHGVVEEHRPPALERLDGACPAMAARNSWRSVTPSWKRSTTA